MRVLVLGGDGFCGWPTALHLSAAGHDVTIFDDLSRRAIQNELGAPSLTPIASPSARSSAWKEHGGLSIDYLQGDARTGRLADLLREHDAIVHMAEQSSAPYSMRSPEHRLRTVGRNLGVTMAVISAAAANPEMHVVHLGTMGVYGYGSPGAPLPEGWIDCRGQRMLHPFRPGSVYHATKCMDAVLLEFAARNDGLAVTDLHQGIVWGTQTAETASTAELINGFYYDGDYGTVLNRFVMQAAVGHPLTVYGSGGQTRAFIHISDTVRCIRMALESPAARGEYRVFNQAAECRRVIDLADLIGQRTGAPVRFIENPRKEAAENDLALDNAGLRSLGWQPVTMDDKALLDQLIAEAQRYKCRANAEKIISTAKW